MSRPLRIEYPGAVYHITARGNARQSIFMDDRDRSLCLDIIGEACATHRGICHSYCLMSNHYHLLLETPEGNLSQIMRHLNGVYTQCFNRRHERVGHVFQGRYKSIVVDKEEYLLQLCRYIVLNPVRAGMVRSAGDYEWSSYKALSGKSKEPGWLYTDWILGQFGQEQTVAQREYARFISAGHKGDAPWQELKGQSLLGGERFINRLLPLLKAKEALKEIPAASRFAHRPALSTIFSIDTGGRKADRNKAMRRAYYDHGYKQKEIADYLGLHYTTVSIAVRKKS